MLPYEIEKLVDEKFLDSEKKEVKDILENLTHRSWNVGTAQLLNGLVKLSKGSLSELKSYLPISDPRDIVMWADEM